MDASSKLTLKEVKAELLDIFQKKGVVNEADLQSVVIKADLSEEDFFSAIEYLNSLGALDEDDSELKEEENIKKEDGGQTLFKKNNFEDQFEAGKNQESSLSMYFAEIGKYPLLTKDEEISLSKRIKKGDKDAEEQLINSNLRLVASIATKYRRLGSSLPYQDLISYGNQGLMTAVKKYDYSKGCRFSTYASFWIKQSITRSIALYGHEIKIPVYVAGNLQKIKSIRAVLTNKLNREPTYDEIAKEVGKGMTASKVEEILTYDNNVISLDKPTGKDEDSKLEDYQTDDSTNPDFSSYKNEDIAYALSILNTREKRMIISRFGLFDESPHTLEEVGKMEGITRERARQIVSEALLKMKNALSKND